MHPLDQVRALPAFVDNYIWAWSHAGELFVVDPGDAQPVKAMLAQEQLSLGAILITHHHPDHTGGVAALLADWPEAPVYGPRKTPYKGVTVPLAEDDTVEIGGATFDILETPGHTLDHIVYVHPRALFCGDTLFAAGCGRLFEGTPAQMWQSLSKLARLPGATPVYCTHEYTLANLKFALAVAPEHRPTQERLDEVSAWRKQGRISLPTRIDIECATNPFLRAAQSEMQSLLKSHGLAADNAEEAFARLREWKDRY